MDWIRANKSLAAILGVAVAGAVGLGVYLFLAFSAYGDSCDKFQALGKKVAGMEKSKLYPSEANVEEKDERVSAYEEEVGKLGGVLTAMQKEVLSKPIQDTEFQAKLKQRIAEIRAKAGSALPGNFAFGFETYIRALPSADAAQDLNEYLDGVDAIVTAALDSGSRKIVALTRTDLEIEKTGAKKPKKAAPPPAAKPVTGKSKKKGKGKGPQVAAKPVEIAKVVERRTVTLDFTTDQAPLQGLLNTLASPTLMKHFTVVRLLRIENEKTEGPLSKVAPLTGTGGMKVLNSDGLVAPAVADPSAPPAEGDKAAPKAEVITAAKPEKPDAVKVLGGEELRVHLEIDLLRFLEPDAEAAAPGSAR